MSETIFLIGLLLVFPPLLLGIINKTKAWFGGRDGPPVLQPYYDLVKLMRKGMVISRTTTWVFQVGPIFTLATIICAGLLVPLGRFNAPIGFTGDMIMFAYVLALGRFFTTTTALDTGSAFEGMGAAREVTFAVLSEPSLFFALLAMARISGSLSLTGMFHGSGIGSSAVSAAPLVMIAIGLFIILLAETSRIPVDDPNTHLELTMIHEVMVLDHSGPLLAVILYGAALKLFVLGALLMQVLAPFHFGEVWADRFLFAAEMAGLAVGIGIVESLMARLRMRRVQYLLTGAMFFCGFGFLLGIR